MVVVKVLVNPSHLAMVVSDDNEFTDESHQIIPTEEVFTMPAFPQEDLEGFDKRYLLPAEVTAFRGIYYHESGDVIGTSPFNYPLDHQGHVASKLHSGTAVYSSYIGLVLTGIVYPQQEDPAVPIDQYGYFDITGMIPPITNHGIWGCLHFLPLVSNIFLARYDSGTFLLHLTESGYCFDVLGIVGTGMYQIYIVAPMVKARMTFIGVGLIYKPHGLFAGGVERCATFLRTFFNRCVSEVDVAPSPAYFLQKRRGVSPLCHSMPTWICVDSIIPCPDVIDKEGADTVSVHSSQTITFRMMITLTHFFHGIEKRAYVFIPLDFKHPRDNQSLWRTGSFSYLDGVWEWVQVICDHVANHYTALAHAYAATKASSNAQVSVKHCASHGVFISHHLAFCPVVKQGWGHYPPKELTTKCQGSSRIL